MGRNRVVGVEIRTTSEREAILPEIGKSYDLSFFWEDRPIQFSVSFGERFVTWLKEGGHHFDIEAGMIVTKDSKRFAVGGNNELYEERTGRTAPPWLFYAADKNVFGLPRGEFFLDLHDSAVTANYSALNIIDRAIAP
ncbi:MAG: hypothetical protein IPK68_22155 [Bdellovibrionales bacterium]|nr:hypothetical protein [Bdellovibrionales bacterium]